MPSDKEADEGSEIYVVDYYSYNNNNSNNNNAVRPPESPSMSMATTAVTNNGGGGSNKRKGGVVIETMSAPNNPCCPNSKGVCCLLLLVNLGLILLTLGFSIVLQLFDPPFVWYCGLLFVVVGLIALISSLIFTVHLCRESRNGGDHNQQLYWTHHWQKRIGN